MRINTNVSSLVAQEAAQNTSKTLTSSLEKLSTGLRINKASDDASGLAIADKLRTQGTSISKAISNGNSAVSLLQIADKSMAEQSTILDTVKAKLIQAATDTTSEEGRAAINADIKKLLTQFDAIAEQTNYNGTQLLDSAKILTFQMGEKAEYDITATTTRASNTDELGGAGTGINISIDKGSTASIKETTPDTEMVVTLAGGAEMKGSTFTGRFDSLAVDKVAEVTFTANDSQTKAAFDAAEGAGLMTKSGDVYSLKTDATAVNFAGQELSFTLNKVTTTTNALTIGSSSNITVTNSSANTDMTTTNTTASNNLGTIKSGSSLTQANANDYMVIIDTSLNELNENRSVFGSTQNQVESAVKNLMTQATNVKAAESIIRDVDYAAESANFNKQNIISQAGSYAISQSNAVQQNVLRLLQ